MVALVAVAGAVIIGGCGGAATEAENDAPRREATPDLPTLTRVPNVVGDKADEAAVRIERARLAATFEPDPDDAELCVVESQDESGEVEVGTEVILTLNCKVDVPDVTGDRASDAVAEIEAIGGPTVVLEGEEGPESSCTVESQNQEGTVEADTEVVLIVDCPLSAAAIEESARDFARDSAADEGGDYEVYSCEPVGFAEGTCEVDYFNSPSGIDCGGQIFVSDEGDTIASRHENFDCESASDF